MVTVVLDSQAGSCGKGKFIGYLAGKDNANIAINNFMSNAGHTYVTEDGTKVMTQHLPTSIINPDTSLVIGPGAAITPSILFKEIMNYADILGDRKVIINPRAVVIKQEHMDTERRVLRSGSTFKGCGASQADKVMRQAELFGSWYNRLDEEDNEFTDEELVFIKEHIAVMDTMTYINDAIDNGEYVMVEGSQG